MSNPYHQSDFSEQHIACPSCDSLVTVPVLQHGEAAYCHFCNFPLSQRNFHEADHVIAYALSALVLLTVACDFPFLTLREAGAESIMTLFNTPIALHRFGMHLLAVMVSLFILLLPLAVMVMTLLLYIPLYWGRPVPWLRFTARWVFALQVWCMVDVFLIAVLVSLVKLVEMAHIDLGIGFWAYVAFTFAFTLMLSSMDRLACWSAIDHTLLQTTQAANGIVIAEGGQHE